MGGEQLSIPRTGLQVPGVMRHQNLVEAVGMPFPCPRCTAPEVTRAGAPLLAIPTGGARRTARGTFAKITRGSNGGPSGDPPTPSFLWSMGSIGLFGKRTCSVRLHAAVSEARQA